MRKYFAMQILAKQPSVVEDKVDHMSVKLVTPRKSILKETKFTMNME